MVSRETVTIFDDLTNEPLEDGDWERVFFALDNKEYEIDLSSENAALLRELLDEYVKAGRRVGGKTKKAKAPADRELGKRMREWAVSNGWEVPARGRLSTQVQDAFHAAHAH